MTPSARNQVIDLIHQGNIPHDKIDEAFVLAQATPTPRSWFIFIQKCLLFMGGLALAFSLLFFSAYNWEAIGHLAKFGLVEGCLIASIICYLIFNKHQILGKASLLVATITLGVLLALVGQTYQTGADPWQLFFYWALLMLPWALISRLPALWVVWFLLLNLSIMLYDTAQQGSVIFTFSIHNPTLWKLIILNASALTAWEYLSTRLDWLAERWAPRLLATAVGFSITSMMVHFTLSSHSTTPLASVVWLIWLASFFVLYLTIKPDLFMLAGGCLSINVVVLCFVGEPLLRASESAGIFIMFLLVIGMGTGSAIWLKNTNKEMAS